MQRVNTSSGRADVKALWTPSAGHSVGWVFSLRLQSAVSTEIFHRAADSDREGCRVYDTSLRGRRFSGSTHTAWLFLGSDKAKWRHSHNLWLTQGHAEKPNRNSCPLLPFLLNAGDIRAAIQSRAAGCQIVLPSCGRSYFCSASSFPRAAVWVQRPAWKKSNCPDEQKIWDAKPINRVRCAHELLLGGHFAFKSCRHSYHMYIAGIIIPVPYTNTCKIFWVR